jgi:rod shape-determining protein MreB
LRANELGASLDERLEQWISRVVEATRVLMETARAILKKAVAKRRADLDAAREVVAAAILRKIPRFDMAVDLGSSMTRIWIRGKGAVLVEPTVVALRNVGGRQIVHAVGTTAAQMIGRTPEHMETVHPLSGGSVVDFEVAEAMLGVFLKQVNNRRKVPSGRLLATVPTLGPEVHRRAVSELCSGAGAPRPVLIERGIAATAGAGTPIADTEPTLVVCIGGGATEICTFSKSRLVSVRSTTRAGQFIDDEIMNALRAEHGMLISAATAERIKQDLSNGEPMDHMQVRGRDLRQGVPRDVSFSSSRILQGLSSVQAIAVDVKDALDTMPAETRAAVSCIHLVGGGALFPPIAVAIGSVTGLKVVLANDPAAVTIGGCGAFVEGTGPLETWNARIG